MLSSTILVGGGRKSHVKRTVLLFLLFRGLKAVLVPLRMFSLKRSTTGAFAVPFRVLGRQNMTGDKAMI